MTNKETARALIQKYFDEVTHHMTWEEAKKCAIIAVDFSWTLLKPQDDVPERHYDKIVMIKEEIEVL